MKTSSTKISLLALSLAFLSNATLSFTTQAMLEDDLNRVFNERQRAYKTNETDSESFTQAEITLPPEAFKHNVRQIYENFFVFDIDSLRKKIGKTEAKLASYCYQKGKEVPQSLEEELFFQEDVKYITLSEKLKRLRKCLAYRMGQRDILLHTVQDSIDRVLEVLYTHPNFIHIVNEELVFSDDPLDCASSGKHPPICSDQRKALETLISTIYHSLTFPLPTFFEPSMPLDMAMDFRQAIGSPRRKKKGLKLQPTETRRLNTEIRHLSRAVSNLHQLTSQQVIERNRIQVEEEYKRQTWSLFCDIVARYTKQYQEECINEMIVAGLNADTILESNWSLEGLLSRGWTPVHMLRAGWKKEHMRRAEWTPRNMREAGWNKETLEKAGWTLADIMETDWHGSWFVDLGWSAKDFTLAGYTFQDLLKRGWPSEDLKGARYTLTLEDVYNTRVPLIRLLADGWRGDELKQAGLTSNNFPTWWELPNWGFSRPLEQLRDLELPAAFFQKNRIPLGDLLTAGWTLTDLITSKWPAEELRAAGWTPIRALQEGFSPDVALYLKGTAADFEEAGVSPAHALEADWPLPGWSLTNIVKIWSPKQLIEKGYTAREILKDGRYTLKDFQNIGWPAEDFKDAGITPARLKELHWSLLDLKGSGWSVQEVLADGYLVDDLIVSGWPPADLINAGCTASTLSPRQLRQNVWAMLNHGWPAKDLRATGYKFDVEDLSGRTSWQINDFTNAGWTPDELIEGGLNASQMAQFSWTLQGLKEAGWTNDQLIRAGWPIEEVEQTAGAAEENSAAEENLED